MKRDFCLTSFYLFYILILIVVCTVDAKELKYSRPSFEIAIFIKPYTTYEQAINNERKINWQTELDKANAITCAYLANELKYHLRLIGNNIKIVDYDPDDVNNRIVIILKDKLAANHPNVAANIDFNTIGDQGFSIQPHKNSLFITANTRNGLLNGVYDLLNKMGFLWYNPDEVIIPDAIDDNIWNYRVEKKPFVKFRGFWTFSKENLSENYVVWLARNRFNIIGKIDPYLAAKLGIKIWEGTHDLIQQEFSKPGLFDLHPEWYTLYKNKRFSVSPKGNYVNPSFANTEGAKYFAKRLIQRLKDGDLKNVDILNIWPSDKKNPRLDQSEIASDIGNSTDQLLHFYLIIAENLKEAYEEGNLIRKVTLAGISYHQTLNPPTNAKIIRSLEELDYLHIFYPSRRDWTYPLSNNIEESEYNSKLFKTINTWRKKTRFSGYGVVDYNNKSNYAGLGLTDHLNFATNFDFYFPKSGGLYTYMHPLKNNPGPLQLTNALISNLSWKESKSDSKAISNQVIDEYFNKRYGKWSSQWKEIYDQMMISVSNAKNIYETESLNSILFQDIYWRKPSYTKEESRGFIERFRKGGSQDVPNGFYGEKGSTLKVNFLGLDESIRIQSQQEVKWDTMLKKVKEQPIRERMKKDILWFKSAKERYQLMALCCEYFNAKIDGMDTTKINEEILNKIEYFSTLSVINDAISPVNQKAFLQIIKEFIQD